MKSKMSNKVLLAINVPIMALLAAIMVVVIALSAVYSDTISLFLYGRAQTADPKALTAGTELCEDIVEEGIVLLKNQKDKNGKSALPLSASEIQRVNVFGWAAYDWMTTAFGSGYSNTALEKIKFFEALKEAGIEYNTTLYNMYKNFYSETTTVYSKTDDMEYRGGVAFGSEKKFYLHEPGKSYYTGEVISEAMDFSDVALVVIGRAGGEGKDLYTFQTKQEQRDKSSTNITDSNRHYLELSTEEEEMIEAAKSACEKVIVILNTSNTMEVGFIDDEEIDAALLVGLTGLTGVRSVIDVLRGKKEVPVAEVDSNGEIVSDEDGNTVYKTDASGKTLYETVEVSPSGRTADTYAYDIFTAPSSVNSGVKGNNVKNGAMKYDGIPENVSQKGYYDAYIDYYEGIYVGYKWYETADKEGFWDDKGGYDKVVQYPFGYGLSYTNFEWKVNRVLVDGKEQKSGELPKGGKIDIYLEVKNIGEVSGMDVVELYYTPQYISGGIEKAYVNLGAFVKTGAIKPGESELVMLELTVQSMASYDCYDANKNNHTGYELDGGDYAIRLMKNSHEIGNMSRDSATGAVIEYTIPSGGYNYDTDEVTGKNVENRFTNADGKGNDKAIDRNDLDGSHETVPVTYMSRSNFKTTYPEKVSRTRSADAYAVATELDPTAEQLAATGYSGITAMPTNGSSGIIQLESMIGEEDYFNSDWDKMISQITINELRDLIRDGYFKTAALPSIGKGAYVDLDGPLGLNTRVTGTTLCDFVAYPSATMLAQTWDTELAHAMGLSIGQEAKSMDKLYGWYAPGANIHRNPFCGRNGEYYSEDGLLSGKMAAATVLGAKQKGVYSYVKHFVANESETYREGLYTFMTEQTLREIYLKPFEIVVKEGGGNALMTSMNRLGSVWTGACRGLCTDILRGEWGFNGTLVTDWMDGGTTYMPAYKGIWAGNDIWLNNADNDKMTTTVVNNLSNPVFITLAQKVAHDVLWTFVDTMNASIKYDPTVTPADLSAGFVYNHTWYWYVALVEVVFAAGIGVMAFFLIKNMLRNKGDAGKAEPAKEETDAEALE